MAAITRGRSVVGAVRSGNPFNTASTSASNRSSLCAAHVVIHWAFDRLPSASWASAISGAMPAAPKNVRLDLAEGDLELLGDFLVAESFQVEEDQGHALGGREGLERLLDQFPAIGAGHLFPEVLRGGVLDFLFLPAAGAHFGEETPARPVTRKVIQAQVGRHLLEPPGGHVGLSRNSANR